MISGMRRRNNRGVSALPLGSVRTLYIPHLTLPLFLSHTFSTRNFYFTQFMCYDRAHTCRKIFFFRSQCILCQHWARYCLDELFHRSDPSVGRGWSSHLEALLPWIVKVAAVIICFTSWDSFKKNLICNVIVVLVGTFLERHSFFFLGVEFMNWF